MAAGSCMRHYDTIEIKVMKLRNVEYINIGGSGGGGGGVGQKLKFYFGGLLFTSHWLNLQQWTSFYIAVYGDFSGAPFFFFQGVEQMGQGPPPPPQQIGINPAKSDDFLKPKYSFGQ